MLSFFKKKYVFYHIPKAGGTTLTAFIDQRFNLAEICPRTFFTPSAILSRGLTSDQSRRIQKYLFVRDHFFFNIAESLQGRVKKLTMLRDPARRVISQFYYYRSYTDEALDSDVANRRMSGERADAMRTLRALSLDEFLRKMPPQFESEFNNTQVAMLAHSPLPFRVPHDAEKVLIAAGKNLNRFSYVGILEFFEPSIQLLCFTFKWFYPDIVQPLNQLDYMERPELLSDQTRSLLQPFVQYDEKIYALAKQEFLKRYQVMIASLLKKDKKFKDSDIKEAVHDPFTPRHQQWIREMLSRDNFSITKRFLREQPHLMQRDACASLRVSMDQAISGKGWLEREGGKNGQLISRWSGPGNESVLSFIIKAKKNYLFSMVVLETLHPLIFQGLKVFANKIEIKIKKEPIAERSFRVSGVIPADVVLDGDYLEIKFVVPRTFSHHEYCGAGDKRQKGIRVSEVSIVPVDSQSLNLNDMEIERVL